jgi:hypothetical protein
MSDRPTLEVDALAVVCYDEGGIDGSLGFRALHLNDARKLERQRDEAREQLINLRVENDHNWQATAELEKMIKLARELRDALQDTIMVVAGYMKRSGAVDILEESRAAITKAKEVLP